MAHKLVDEMYKYYSVLKNRDPENGLHVVYEDEYDQLKKLHTAACEAVSEIKGGYSKALKDELDSLFDVLDDAEYFLNELENSRKTD